MALRGTSACASACACACARRVSGSDPRAMGAAARGARAMKVWYATERRKQASMGTCVSANSARCTALDASATSHGNEQKSATASSVSRCVQMFSVSLCQVSMLRKHAPVLRTQASGTRDYAREHTHA